MAETSRTTRLFHRLANGDIAAGDELLPLVYEELRRLAERQMGSEAAGHTLQPTALVHEAWLRLIGDLESGPADRRQFFGLAAHVMRNVLVDHARARRAAKRGGSRAREPLDQALVVYEDRAHNIVALDEALEQLAQVDAQLVELIELRFFGGLTNIETAAALNMPLRTCERGWATARAWLRAAMNEA